MKVDEKLVQAAINFVNHRFPLEIDQGAAAIYLEDGKILISTAPVCVNESVSLCHETGAICEAYKRNKKITATVCVSRGSQGFHILTPCGVCQERLWSWGGDIDCAIPSANDSTKWQSLRLSDLSPHYWRRPFMD